MDSRRLTLSVIVPVYNEINTIATVLERVRNIPLRKEIIVVNDGSTDGTSEFLEDELDRDMTIVLNSPFNLGKGAAVRLGLEHVQGEIVIIQDSDLELNPDEIPRLIQPIQEGRTDVVYGSRFLHRGRWGRVPGQPFAAWLANVVPDPRNELPLRLSSHRHGDVLQGVSGFGYQSDTSGVHRLRVRAGADRQAPQAGLSYPRDANKLSTQNAL